MDVVRTLLSSEYDDFNETVVLESPFAETTRDGYGIVQLHIGLTERELLVAEQRPEGPELSGLAPLPAVALSVFRRRQRRTLKAHFANGRVRYFELAAPRHREKFWTLWQNKLKDLDPALLTPTQSATSVISSLSSNFSKQQDTTWQERDVFLGQEFGQGESKQEPRPAGTPHIPRVTEPDLLPPNRRKETDKKVYPVNRFGAGIDERCSTALYLPVQISLTPNFDSLTYQDSEESVVIKEESFVKMAPLDYTLASLPYLLFGLGLYPLSPVEAKLAQLRKHSSYLYLGRRTGEIEDGNVPRRLLVSGVSAENLLRCEWQQRPWLAFWTPALSYRPRSPARSYRALRQHLQRLAVFLSDTKKGKSPFSRDRKTWKRDDNWQDVQQVDSKTEIRRKLKLDIALSCWDFDSTVIAHQITLIYVDLFLRIPWREARSLRRERSAENAPNWRAFVGFSCRLAGLVATEILRMASVQMRTRLIARWVNVADKLHRLQNLEGVTAVLLGLQSPGVFVLKESWAYTKKHHSSKYKRLVKLCRLHSEPRSRQYAAMVGAAVRSGPYVLSAGFIAAVLLDWAEPSPDAAAHGSGAEGFWRGWSWAAGAYRLPDELLAREFLLKAAYLEDRDNLAAARHLEPVHLQDESLPPAQ